MLNAGVHFAIIYLNHDFATITSPGLSQVTLSRTREDSNLRPRFFWGKRLYQLSYLCCGLLRYLEWKLFSFHSRGYCQHCGRFTLSVYGLITLRLIAALGGGAFHLTPRIPLPEVVVPIMSKCEFFVARSGVEPLLSEPKADVLTVTPHGHACGSLRLPPFRVSVFSPEAFHFFAGEHHPAALGGCPIQASATSASAGILSQSVT